MGDLSQTIKETLTQSLSDYRSATEQLRTTLNGMSNDQFAKSHIATKIYSFLDA